jgi:hypothetical protein
VVTFEEWSMSGLDRCTVCGVPLMVSSELRWEDNGVISLASSPRNRMVFFESETIDQIFKGIEDLIGLQIERMVIESRGRETRRYIQRAFPPEVRKIIESKGTSLEERWSRMSPDEKENLLNIMRIIVISIHEIARVYGYADQWFGESWESGADYPWRFQDIRNPYSLLFISADNLGAVEAFEGIDMWVRYQEIGKDAYRTEVYHSDHPRELKERLKRRRYDFKPGDISYEGCPECGIPLAVARRTWDLENAVIRDPDTDRRMAIFGPFTIDSVCDDLESELGEAVPDAVIESTRRYIRNAWGVDRWNRDGSSFQQMIAVRGLGNLVHFEGDAEHLDLVIQNACLHLPMTGAVQALVELAYQVESSSVKWALTDDGVLSITIRTG